MGVQRDNPSGKGAGGCAPNSTTHAGGWAGTTPVPLWQVVQIGDVQKFTCSQAARIWPDATLIRLRGLRFFGRGLRIAICNTRRCGPSIVRRAATTPMASGHKTNRQGCVLTRVEQV